MRRALGSGPGRLRSTRRAGARGARAAWGLGGVVSYARPCASAPAAHPPPRRRAIRRETGTTRALSFSEHWSTHRGRVGLHQPAVVLPKFSSELMQRTRTERTEPKFGSVLSRFFWLGMQFSSRFSRYLKIPEPVPSWFEPRTVRLNSPKKM